MKKAQLLYCFVVLGLVSLVAHAVSINLWKGNSLLLAYSTDILSFVASFGAALGFWLLFAFLPKRTSASDRWVWLLIALTFTYFFLGDIAWAVQELAFGVEVPLGSFPDFFWTFGYITLIVGLIAVFRAFGVAKLFPSKIIMLATAAVACAYSLFNIMDFSRGVYGLDIFIQNMYPVLDIVLLGFISVLILSSVRNDGKRISCYKGWTFFGLSVLSLVIFDFAFAGLTTVGSYYSGHPIDLLYTASYVLAAIAAYVHSETCRI